MKNLHISPKEVSSQSEAIFRLIKFGESGVAICYPGCKIEYNVTAFLERPVLLKKVLGKYYKRYRCLPVFLDKSSTILTITNEVKNTLRKEYSFTQDSTLSDMVTVVADRGEELFLFLLNTQTVPKNEFHTLLAQLHALRLTSHKMNILVCIEADIFSDEYAQIFLPYSTFLQNILYFPCYTKEESRFFIQTLADEWSLQLTDETINSIIDTCGGILWLLRETLRVLRDRPTFQIETLSEQDGIKTRLKTIFDQFSESEKKVLIDIVTTRVVDNRSSLAYLHKLGFVEEKNQSYSLTVPLFKPLILEYQQREKAYNKIETLLTNIEHFQQLTKSEKKILQFLQSKPNTLITRDELAEVIWQEKWKEKYTDWALDKKISRLKKTLEEKDINPNVILVKKGQGFIFQY